MPGSTSPRGGTWRLDIPLLSDERSLYFLRAAVRGSLISPFVSQPDWDSLELTRCVTAGRAFRFGHCRVNGYLSPPFTVTRGVR